jgi:hypothetical protein
MIDEIPIIGVTEWTVDGLAAKEFRRRAGSPGHRLDGVQASRVGKGRVADRGSTTELRFRANGYFRLEPVG